jgi:hypothetical protein
MVARARWRLPSSRWTRTANASWTDAARPRPPRRTRCVVQRFSGIAIALPGESVLPFVAVVGRFVLSCRGSTRKPRWSSWSLALDSCWQTHTHRTHRTPDGFHTLWATHANAHAHRTGVERKKREGGLCSHISCRVAVVANRMILGFMAISPAAQLVLLPVPPALSLSLSHPALTARSGQRHGGLPS